MTENTIGIEELHKNVSRQRIWLLHRCGTTKSHHNHTTTTECGESHMWCGKPQDLNLADFE